MSHHQDTISKLNGLIYELHISEGKNVEKLTENKNETELFKTQQFVMEVAIHCCDISQMTRSFEVAKEWVYLLFDEFFMQGDIELAKELPISMLCDRKTTNVAGAQPGFINFVTLPLYNPFSQVLPVLNECCDHLKANAATWKTYIETEDDKKVYIKKLAKNKLDNIVENEDSDYSNNEEQKPSQL